MESIELGGWLRFSAVAVLTEVYASSGDIEKALPLLEAWSFPAQLHELDGPAVAHFHTLGAEVHARLGQPARTQAYLDFLASVPVEHRSLEVPRILAVVRALHHQSIGDDAMAQAGPGPGPRRCTPSV